eukprot:6204128-Pleurochrysis_carterae.AAC.2
MLSRLPASFVQRANAAHQSHKLICGFGCTASSRGRFVDRTKQKAALEEGLCGLQRTSQGSCDLAAC